MNVVLDQLVSALDVRPVSNLLSHEQTIPENVERLRQITLENGHLTDPLIVDGDTNVVLDGNHRLQVLQLIGCPFAVCQPVTYTDPKISVGTWLPATTNSLDDLLQQIKIRYKKIDVTTDQPADLAIRAPFVALQYSNGRPTVAALLEPGSYALAELLEVQHRIMTAFGNVSWNYIPDDHAEAYLKRGYTVLLRRPFSKMEITQSAEAHLPFPPKSTRHILPERIIRLNMKLEWLRGDRDEALRRMRDMLIMRVYDGSVRRYDEPVIVIY